MDRKLPDQEELNKTADALIEAKDAILEIWKKQIQKELFAARQQTRIALEDHMPSLLEEMAVTIRRGEHSGSTDEQDKLSQLHGRQRASLGVYTLVEVLDEYRIAREILITELGQIIPLSVRCQRLINRIIDSAIVESGAEFSRLKAIENDEAKKRAEEAQKRAEAANHAKSDFLANISHEIRTPLGAVLGFMELMADPNLTGEERSTFAEIATRNGRQLSNLISDILDISKIEAGQMIVESVATSLPSIVAEVTTLLRASAEAKGIQLRVESWTNIPQRVGSDPMRLTQILTNIIGNAIKFTTKGEVRVALKRVTEIGPDAFCFVVSDTGIGISEQSQSQLFRSFSQADTSTTRRFGGSGLGLFLSKKLANALGGDLILERSKLHEGSTFVATFKVALMDDHRAAQAASHVPAAQRQFRLKGVRILLADDSPDNQVLVSQYLLYEGATIELADNGEQVLKLVQAGSFDVILMDIQMPLMDGYEATQRLREMDYIKPIIALTANAMSSERAKALASGCDDYLTKPVYRNELVSTLLKYIPEAASEENE